MRGSQALKVWEIHAAKNCHTKILMTVTMPPKLAPVEKSSTNNYDANKGLPRKNSHHKQSQAVVRSNVIVTGINNGGISIHASNTSSHGDVEYEKELEGMGKILSVKGEELIVRSYVNSTLWRKKKFISASREVDFGGRLCTRVLADLKVGKADGKEFWLRNRTKLQKWLCVKRNNMIGCIKRDFLSKYKCV